MEFCYICIFPAVLDKSQNIFFINKNNLNTSRTIIARSTNFVSKCKARLCIYPLITAFTCAYLENCSIIATTLHKA